jgi:hypothetical protein
LEVRTEPDKIREGAIPRKGHAAHWR